MARRLVIVLSIAAVAALAYLFVLAESREEPRVVLPQATATIGTGSEAVAVGADGAILEWLPLSEELQLPRLPLDGPPDKGILGGPVREQARVLGAAPAALRPYLEASYFGDNGVEVRLRAGIELRFGDATQADLKWRAAAAVLADPAISALDYVNLQAPRRPTVAGSGHTLPPIR